MVFLETMLTYRRILDSVSVIPHASPMAIPAERAERKVLSIGDLTRRVKSTLETGIPYVWVAGEMSNYKGPGPSGHLYFTLKDAESAVPCAMWRGFAAKLKFEPENGMQVVAGGRVDRKSVV